MPTAPEPELPMRYTFDVISVVHGSPDGPRLRTSWRWSERLTSAEDVDRITALWSRAVAALGEAL